MVMETMMPASSTETEFELQLLPSVVGVQEESGGSHCGGCFGCSGCAHLE